MDWLSERVTLVDEDGQPVSADALEMPDEPDEDAADEPSDAASDDPSEEE